MEIVDKDTGEVNPFIQFLADLEDGQFVEDLAEKLTELVADIRNKGQTQGGKPKGVMAINFNMRLNGKTVDVLAGCKLTKPKLVRDNSIFWLTKGMGLSRTDPRQTEMELKTPAKRKLKEV